MASWGKLKALLLKNWLIWKRKLKGSLCELLFPIILVALLLLLRVALPTEKEKAESQLKYAEQVGPYDYEYKFGSTVYDDFGSYIEALGSPTSLIPFLWTARTLKDDWKYAIVPQYLNTKDCESQITKAGSFEKYLSDNIDQFLDLGQKVLNNTAAKKPYVRCFNTDKELKNWVTSSKYDDKKENKISFAIVIKSLDTTDSQSLDVDLAIRYNFTDTNPDDQSIFGSFYQIFLTDYNMDVNKYQRGIILDYQRNFVSSGFLNIINFATNFFMNVGAPDGQMGKFGGEVVPMPQLKYTKDVFSTSFAGTLGFLFFITGMVPIAKLISLITTEKFSKAREAMRMMGLTDTPYWLSWIIMYSLIYFVIALLCSLIAIPIFSHQSWFLVFLLFFLYGLSCMTFSLLISAIFTKPKTAVLVGILVFFIMYFPLFSFNEATTKSTKTGVSVFNVAAMALGFYTLLMFEGNQVSINLGNANEEFDAYTMQICLLMLLADIFIYLLLALYLDKVIPSESGVNLKWYFPFTKSFWKGHQTQDTEVDQEKRDSIRRKDKERVDRLRENDKIEPIDTAMERQLDSGQAMIVRGLRKNFGSKTAVAGLDIEMFEGQIFALLGHNGAGKTTTISMLTGMLKPTAGDMSVHGLNFKTDMAEIRKSLGICPQHNILFKELTVQEHLYIFCRFKGIDNKAQIQQEIDEQINAIDLNEKRNTRADFLSGGQKRKLSLAIALIAGSSVVMLDEPTSGMDLTARRRMWDMLRNQKRGRIIILTTHYMEEADILADRIAIMHEGKLNCLGSPLFLKNRFGVGYNLTIVSAIGATNGREVRSLVDKHISNASILSESSAEISFRIPMTESPSFRGLFDELDSKMKQLNIEAYGISVTTLEEVFLRVARGDEELTTEKRKTARLSREMEEESKDMEIATEMEVFSTENSRIQNFNVAEDRKTGTFYIFFNHSWALLEKRVMYSIRDFKGVCCEILLPIVLVVLGLVFLTQVAQFNNMESKNLTLSDYSNPQNIAYNNLNPYAEGMMDKVFQGQQNGLAVTNSTDSKTIAEFDDGLLTYTDYHKSKRMGSYFISDANETYYDIAVFQNTTAFQAPAVFLTAIGQAAAQASLDARQPGTTFNMKVSNDPLPLTKRQASVFKNANTITATMIFAIGMAFIPTGLITFIVKEREANIKHQHLVSGVSIPAYWLSSYVWDFAKYQIPGILCPLFIKAFELKSLSDSSEAYSMTWLLFIFFGLAIPTFSYCNSFLFKNYSTAQFIIFMFNMVMGAIAPLVVWILRLISDTTRNVADVIMWPLRAVAPIFCFSFGLMNVANVDTYQLAYGEDSKRGVYDWKIAGADLFFLFLSAVFYLVLLFLIEYFKTFKCIQNFASAKDPGPNQYRRDDDVENLKEQIATVDPKTVAVKVEGLRKVYGTIGGQRKVAIEELNFWVPFQECFALLGVNGAGKTSTFRILTGEYAPTKGEAYISGYSVVTEISKARYNIGYCPQFDALSELLTPREHLKLYAKIKGIPNELVPGFVEKQLTDMGLKKYEKTNSGALSGGNKRKLSVAMACIGNPPVVFLDEPSAGMDPGARKNMWKVINTIKRQKCSIILTTHSMDEAEALCNTIGIMVGGRLRCFGTSTHIKNKFSSGFEFELKVKLPSEEDIAEKIQTLTPYIVQEEYITQNNVEQALVTLGAEEFHIQISDFGSGSHLHAEIVETKKIAVKTLTEWAQIEILGREINRWLVSTFPSANLGEHYGQYFLFKIENHPEQSIGVIFGLIEDQKERLQIGEYSLSQTTLEQIFNMFATEPPLRNSGPQSAMQVVPN